MHMDMAMESEQDDVCPEYDPYTVADQVVTSTILVSSVLMGDTPRLAGVDLQHVRLLAELNPEDLPPVLVRRQTMRLVDGVHRLKAALLRGDRTISAKLLDCDEAAAFVLAVRANALHGKPLSRTERIVAVKRILSDHPDWSDRTIASYVGLGTKTVRTVRGRSTDVGPQLNARIGRDGRRRPLNGAQGRQRAGQIVQSTACCFTARDCQGGPAYRSAQHAMSASVCSTEWIPC